MITERQEKILDELVREYINSAEPISSKLLKDKVGLDICEATIRNELQDLTEQGYINQPHTSAGRVPTEKAYRYFIDTIFDSRDEIFTNFVSTEIESARKRINEELRLVEELTKTLEEASLQLSIESMPKEKNILYEVVVKLGPTRITYDKNISIINSLIKELENL
jgi:heat-inducible transcriptional repressor